MKKILKNIGKAGVVAGAFALPGIGIPASVYAAKKLFGKKKPKPEEEKPPGKFKEWFKAQNL